MTWQEKAINHIRQMFPAQTGVLVDHIRAAARLGRSESICRRIAQAKNTEQILDYVAEVGFGLLFAHLRFATGFEPLGLKGPDLSISRDGHSAYVEVKRFRSDGHAEEICRSEEHTSELQSPCNLVCRLLLEKKKHNQSLARAVLFAKGADHYDRDLAIRNLCTVWVSLTYPLVLASGSVRTHPSLLIRSRHGNKS